MTACGELGPPRVVLISYARWVFPPVVTHLTSVAPPRRPTLVTVVTLVTAASPSVCAARAVTPPTSFRHVPLILLDFF